MEYIMNHWCYTLLLSIFCLLFKIKIRVSVHNYQCVLYMLKLLILPFALYYNLIIYLQILDSRQDHPAR